MTPVYNLYIILRNNRFFAFEPITSKIEKDINTATEFPYFSPKSKHKYALAIATGHEDNLEDILDKEILPKNDMFREITSNGNFMDKMLYKILNDHYCMPSYYDEDTDEEKDGYHGDGIYLLNMSAEGICIDNIHNCMLQ